MVRETQVSLVGGAFPIPGFELGNPIEYTEYLNEDFMGKVAPWATRKCGNNSHQAVAWGCMQRVQGTSVNVASVMHVRLNVVVIGQPSALDAHAHATHAFNQSVN